MLEKLAQRLFLWIVVGRAQKHLSPVQDQFVAIGTILRSAKEGISISCEIDESERVSMHFGSVSNWYERETMIVSLALYF